MLTPWSRATAALAVRLRGLRLHVPSISLCSKNDIEISIQRVEGSAIYLLRSTVRVPLPVAATHAHYTVRATRVLFAPGLHRAARACRRARGSIGCDAQFSSSAFVLMR